MFTVRFSIPADKEKILSLYSRVATISRGIALSEEELSVEYVEDFMQNAALTGVELVVEHPDNANIVIAEMHGYKLLPKVFEHVLTNLTIAVDPDFQSRGIGKLMFTRFIEHITNNRPDILRVELVTQESNLKALNLYRAIGFVIEGRLENRIAIAGKQTEADIPLAWFNKNYDKD